MALSYNTNSDVITRMLVEAIQKDIDKAFSEYLDKKLMELREQLILELGNTLPTRVEAIIERALETDSFNLKVEIK